MSLCSGQPDKICQSPDDGMDDDDEDDPRAMRTRTLSIRLCASDAAARKVVITQKERIFEMEYMRAIVCLANRREAGGTGDVVSMSIIIDTYETTNALRLWRLFAMAVQYNCPKRFIIAMPFPSRPLLCLCAFSDTFATCVRARFLRVSRI